MTIARACTGTSEQPLFIHWYTGRLAHFRSFPVAAWVAEMKYSLPHNEGHLKFDRKEKDLSNILTIATILSYTLAMTIAFHVAVPGTIDQPPVIWSVRSLIVAIP
jgi:hypothetical protein